MSAGPVADQPVRPRTPPGVGTPLRADGLPGRRHPRPQKESEGVARPSFLLAERAR